MSVDEMITLHTVQPGVLVAVWKHSWKVATAVSWECRNRDNLEGDDLIVRGANWRRAERVHFE